MAAKKKARVARKKAVKKAGKTEKKKSSLPLGIKVVAIILLAGAIISIISTAWVNYITLNLDRSSFVVYSISALQFVGALYILKLKKTGLILCLAVQAFMIFNEIISLGYTLSTMQLDANSIVTVSQLPLDLLIVYYLVRKRLLFK